MIKTILWTQSKAVIEHFVKQGHLFVLTEPHFSYHTPKVLNDEEFIERIQLTQGNWALNINAYLEDPQLNHFKEKLELHLSYQPKAVYFSDFAVYEYLNELQYKGDKVYAPETILTNHEDLAFYLEYVDRCVIAKELTLDEMVDLSQHFPKKLEFFNFGHMMMSVSKRPLLSNYMDEIGKTESLLNRLDVSIQETQREGWMPILEEKNAFSTYRAEILYGFEYSSQFTDFYAQHCDDLFIEENDFITLIEAGLLHTEIPSELKQKYSFDLAYFFRKTNLTKEELKA